MGSDLLSTRDVARMYGVSTSTIRRWIKLGILGYTIVGSNRVRRTIRIPRAEADKHFKPVPAEVQ